MINYNAVNEIVPIVLEMELHFELHHENWNDILRTKNLTNNTITYQCHNHPEFCKILYLKERK